MALHELGVVMANLALYDTTLAELQEFLRKSALPLTEKFTVIFNHDIDDVVIGKLEQTTESVPFHDFTKDEFFGMWADREDMADSVEYVRKLRREQWGHDDNSGD